MNLGLCLGRLCDGFGKFLLDVIDPIGFFIFKLCHYIYANLDVTLVNHPLYICLFQCVWFAIIHVYGYYFSCMFEIS